MNGRGHKINQRSQQFWLRWHMHQETLSLRNINIIYTFISGTHWHLNFWSFWRLKWLSLSRAFCCNRSTLTPLFPLLYKKYYKIWSKNIKRIYFIFFTLKYSLLQALFSLCRPVQLSQIKYLRPWKKKVNINYAALKCIKCKS